MGAGGHSQLGEQGGTSIAKRIPLTQGKFALVDDDVYEWAMQWKWYAHRDGKNFYVHRNSGKPLRKTIQLHREIMATPEGMFIDHINGDATDCRRENMRLANRAENGWNRGPNTNNASGYKGVFWNSKLQKWHAAIKVNGKNRSLGQFASAEEAAKVYDAAAREHFGEFAWTNFQERE